MHDLATIAEKQSSLSYRLCAMPATLTESDLMHKSICQVLDSVHMCRNVETGQEQEAHPLDEYFAELIR